MTSDVPELTPAYAAQPPRVDGRLDDPCWQNVTPLANFTLTTRPEPAEKQTIVRAICTKAALYFSFECLENEMDRLVVKHFQDGQPIWQDDCIEIFISPFAIARPDNFHHFVVNAAGAKTRLYREAVRENGSWEAAVSRESDRWIIEVGIPFSELRPAGKNEDCWRINFGREARTSGETSSWSPVPTWFASPWRFGRLLQPPRAKFITFRCNVQAAPPSSDETGTKPVDHVPLPPRSTRPLIPQPREMRKRKIGRFIISRETKILIGQGADAIDRRAAEEINQEISRLLGYELDIERTAAPGPVFNAIVVGERTLNPVAHWIAEQDGLPAERRPEGYILDVSPERILITGADRVGTFWGAQTLRELIRPEGQVGAVDALFIRDWPEFRFRGVHLLAQKDGLEFHSKLIEQVLSRFKINYIVLQTDKIDWQSHPEVRDPDNFMPRADVRKLIQVARDHHIQVIPLSQCLGHAEWAFRNGANLDICEDPRTPYAFCATRSATYDFVFSIVDEALELFGNPGWFHAGLDEFDMRGEYPYCESCKKIGKYEAYATCVRKVHEHLTRKGARMMMWGDVLCVPGYRETMASIPKDILINDWRYGPLTEYPTLDFYRESGFPVIGGTWYNPQNIYWFSLDARRKGIEGMLQTTWTGFQPEEVVLKRWPEQLYAYILAAAWFWSPGRPTLEDLPYEPDAVFDELWSGSRPPNAMEGRWFTIGLGPYCNIATADSGRWCGWLGLGNGVDLRNLPWGLVNLANVPYQILRPDPKRAGAIMLRGPSLTSWFPKSVDGIKVGARADALHFLHMTAYYDGKDREVGAYIIHYDDGTNVRIPLIYGQNIAAWDESEPAFAYGLSWRGKASDGRFIRLRSFRWVNPDPEKEISTIDFISADSQAAPVLLAITGECSS